MLPLPGCGIFVSAWGLLLRASNSHFQARSSVGEHFPDTEGVGGSNPPVPTIMNLPRTTLRSALGAPAARLRPLRVSLEASWRWALGAPAARLRPLRVSREASWRSALGARCVRRCAPPTRVGCFPFSLSLQGEGGATAPGEVRKRGHQAPISARMMLL